MPRPPLDRGGGIAQAMTERFPLCGSRSGSPSYNLSVSHTLDSSPCMGASGEEGNFLVCQSLLSVGEVWYPARLNREPKSLRHVLSRVGGFLMRAIQFLCRYSSLCLAACDIMFVILHIIVAEHGHKLGVVCLVGIQVKLAASAAAFLHTAGHKVVE